MYPTGSQTNYTDFIHSISSHGDEEKLEQMLRLCLWAKTKYIRPALCSSNTSNILNIISVVLLNTSVGNIRRLLWEK